MAKTTRPSQTVRAALAFTLPAEHVALVAARRMAALRGRRGWLPATLKGLKS